MICYDRQRYRNSFINQTAAQKKGGFQGNKAVASRVLSSTGGTGGPHSFSILHTEMLEGLGNKGYRLSPPQEAQLPPQKVC